MQIRPATAADIDAIVELCRRWETVRFGAPEHDADEVRETFGGEGTLAERSRLVFDGDLLRGAAWYWSAEALLLADPDIDPAPVYDDLVPWFAAHEVALDVLGTDEPLRARVRADGWTYRHSSFELIRAVSGDWAIAEPTWPADIEVTDLRPDDTAAIHHLIYVDAAWAEVAGHPDREYEQWRDIFVTDKELPEQQVLAWRDGRLVGVSMGRIFSDGAGWVAQLAVAKTERGQGLGRALLLEALRRRIAGGATMVGLSVEGENRSAIGLYLDVGLTVDREWQKFSPPR